MTVNKRKKFSRYRGSMTHGGGSKKKRRGSGNRGGKGMAGSGKRSDSKKPSLWKQKYFGKYGFVSKNGRNIKSVNINYLEENISKMPSDVLNKENDFFSINLEKLGFRVGGSFIEIPAVRTDISIFEDLIEEIVNLYGYDKLPSEAPVVTIKPSGYEDLINFKDTLRRVLMGFGLSEVYNYSFIAGGEKNLVALENPISEDKKYLRPSLMSLLNKNLDDNLRFYDAVRIFEIGKVFHKSQKSKVKGQGLTERLMLGMAIGVRHGNPILNLKGMVEQLLSSVGLVDYFMKEEKSGLRIKSDHHVIGYLDNFGNNRAVAEIDLEKLLTLVKEEKSYEPLKKYPSVMRDLSLFVPEDIRIGNILVLIQSAAPKFLEDVDMIDFYDPSPEAARGQIKGEAPRKSITFRMVFQADDHTLTDKEVGKEMEKIISALQSEFDAEIR